MTSIPDPLLTIESSCQMLREQLASQLATLRAVVLECDNLKVEIERLRIERDGIWQLYTEQVRKEMLDHPEKVAAEWQPVLEEIKGKPHELSDFVKELERSACHSRSCHIHDV